jgi:hypothetical protein
MFFGGKEGNDRVYRGSLAEFSFVLLSSSQLLPFSPKKSFQSNKSWAGWKLAKQKFRRVFQLGRDATKIRRLENSSTENSSTNYIKANFRIPRPPNPNLTLISRTHLDLLVHKFIEVNEFPEFYIRLTNIRGRLIFGRWMFGSTKFRHIVRSTSVRVDEFSFSSLVGCRASLYICRILSVWFWMSRPAEDTPM